MAAPSRLIIVSLQAWMMGCLERSLVIMDTICHSMLAQIHITLVFVNEKQVKTTGEKWVSDRIRAVGTWWVQIPLGSSPIPCSPRRGRF